MSVLHQIALTFVPGLGDITARTLLEYLGTAEAIFSASKAKLANVPGIRKKTVEAILHKEALDRAEKELKFIEKYKIQPVFFTDEAYPKRLRNCYDAPVLLYYKGKVPLNSSRIVSIVGTRNATSYGKELTRKLIEDLKAYQVFVVSGLAHGIDGVAHKSCLKNEVPTIGVLGHGLDRIYPAAHRDLAEKMIENGGLLTEFPSETNPDRENFPKRNRIVAGMADATIIIEAGLKGGALITAELANSYNRDVFAYPGSVHEEFSAGCNYLIKTNRANLITGIKDLEYLLGWSDQQQLTQKKNKQTSLALNLSAEEQLVMDTVQSRGATGIDELTVLTNIPQSKLAITILELEMKGVLCALPGKMYKPA